MNQMPPHSLFELLNQVRQCNILLANVREEMDDYNKSLFSDELDEIDEELYQTAGNIAEVILESF